MSDDNGEDGSRRPSLVVSPPLVANPRDDEDQEAGDVEEESKPNHPKDDHDHLEGERHSPPLVLGGERGLYPLRPTHDASLSRMTSAMVTPRLRASRSRRRATGSATTTRRERTSPSGFMTRGLAIPGTLIGGCRENVEYPENRPHRLPQTSRRRPGERILERGLRASSPESASCRRFCRRCLGESLGEFVKCRREQTSE